MSRSDLSLPTRSCVERRVTQLLLHAPERLRWSRPCNRLLVLVFAPFSRGSGASMSRASSKARCLPADPRDLLEGRSLHADACRRSRLRRHSPERSSSATRTVLKLYTGCNDQQGGDLEAAMEKSVAVVTVRFEAYIAAITRNWKGKVVSAGSLSECGRETPRTVGPSAATLASRDPNWRLIRDRRGSASFAMCSR